jgi:hypothetical protein
MRISSTTRATRFAARAAPQVTSARKLSRVVHFGRAPCGAQTGRRSHPPPDSAVEGTAPGDPSITHRYGAQARTSAGSACAMGRRGPQPGFRARGRVAYNCAPSTAGRQAEPVLASQPGAAPARRAPGTATALGPEDGSGVPAGRAPDPGFHRQSGISGAIRELTRLRF